MHRLHHGEFVLLLLLLSWITEKIFTEMFNLALSFLDIATNCTGDHQQSFQMACKSADEDCN